MISNIPKSYLPALSKHTRSCNAHAILLRFSILRSLPDGVLSSVLVVYWSNIILLPNKSFVWPCRNVLKLLCRCRDRRNAEFDASSDGHHSSIGKTQGEWRKTRFCVRKTTTSRPSSAKMMWSDGLAVRISSGLVNIEKAATHGSECAIAIGIRGLPLSSSIPTSQRECPS